MPRSFSETWTWIVSAAHEAMAAAWSFSSMWAWKLSYIIRKEGWSTARTNRAVSAAVVRK